MTLKRQETDRSVPKAKGKFTSREEPLSRDLKRLLAARAAASEKANTLKAAQEDESGQSPGEAQPLTVTSPHPYPISQPKQIHTHTK